MTSWKTPAFVALSLLAAGSALSGAHAQQGPWNADAQRPAAPAQGSPKAVAQSKSTTPAKNSAAAKAAAKDEAPRPDAQLRQRIEQLEEQLADMQVQMGTLESLGKGGGASSASPAFRGGSTAGGGADAARVDSLETQMRALSAQVEQLATQVRQMNGRRADAASPLGEQPVAPRPDFADARPGTPPADAARAAGGFGQLTVTPGGESGDAIGRLITKEPEHGSGGGPVAALPPQAASAGSPKELYETSYAYLLQQDYASAEVSFEEFLKRYPADRQAADAQYWYGETLYVQRRYKPAAQAFLKVMEKHQASSKVPNSILKVGLSLEQLGQKDCGLLNELDARYPNAPADVKTKARALRQRVGC